MNLLNRLTFRPENTADHRQVEELTRKAFWNLYGPGCDEHFMVHQLRKSPGYISELSFVACDGDRVLGHILYTRSYILDDDGQKHDVISFGPVSVLPEYQKLGIGSSLIRQTMAMAKNQGRVGIFIYGDPKYCHRFGFKNAKHFNISTADGENFEEFMGLELHDGGLSGIKGRLHQDAAFKVDKAALEAFDSTFS